MSIKSTFVNMVAEAKKGAKFVGKKLFLSPFSGEELDKAIKSVNEINADKKMPDSVRQEALKNVIIKMKYR